MREPSEPHRVEITSYNGGTNPQWNSNDLKFLNWKFLPLLVSFATIFLVVFESISQEVSHVMIKKSHQIQKKEQKMYTFKLF